MKINSLKGSLIGLLVLGAMFTTYSTISYVSAKDYSKGFNPGEAQAISSNLPESNLIDEAEVDIINQHKKRSMELSNKGLNTMTKSDSYIKSEEVKAPETLEEAIDFSQYPTATVIATGYTAGVESTGKTPDHPLYGVTYSGVQVRRDLYSTIAADLNMFPIGTILYIPDYGYGVVADKGGAIKGNKIDLYYETVEDVYNYWGKKEVEVYIIKKGNGKLTSEQLDVLNETESLQAFRQEILEE